LFFDEAFQSAPGIDALWWLRAGTIQLPHDPQVGGVLINAQQHALADGFCHLRGCRGCGELILAMSVGLHIDVGVDVLIGHLKLPPVAALANTHAILGRWAQHAHGNYSTLY
jgi:hypothetical protein